MSQIEKQLKEVSEKMGQFTALEQKLDESAEVLLCPDRHFVTMERSSYFDAIGFEGGGSPDGSCTLLQSLFMCLELRRGQFHAPKNCD